jgi:NADPH-dependent 2,4-dienoyl-CoA reductase/sulfur reductase-like enzyme
MSTELSMRETAGRELGAEVLVVGGGAGGVAAALAALRRGRTVVLTEETDWLGGQLSARGWGG